MPEGEETGEKHVDAQLLEDFKNLDEEKNEGTEPENPAPPKKETEEVDNSGGKQEEEGTEGDRKANEESGQTSQDDRDVDGNAEEGDGGDEESPLAKIVGENGLDFPEDTVLSDEIQTKFSRFADKLEIDDDTLTEIHDMLEEATNEGLTLLKNVQDSKAEEIHQELIDDPIFSNANQKQTFNNIETVINKFGGEDAQDIMNHLTTIGNMPVGLARLLNGLGQALNERPEFGGKSVDMKLKSDKKSPENKEEDQLRKQHAVFF